MRFWIYRSFQAFTQIAKQLWHPYDELKNLPEDLVRVLFQHLSRPPDVITRERIATLTNWASRAKALNNLEKQLKADMEPDIARIMAPKRILLMRSIATDMSWPDLGIFDEMTEGFKIVGTGHRVRDFQTRNHPGRDVTTTAARQDQISQADDHW